MVGAAKKAALKAKQAGRGGGGLPVPQAAAANVAAPPTVGVVMNQLSQTTLSNNASQATPPRTISVETNEEAAPKPQEPDLVLLEARADRKEGKVTNIARCPDQRLTNAPKIADALADPVNGISSSDRYVVRKDNVIGPDEFWVLTNHLPLLLNKDPTKSTMTIHYYEVNGIPESSRRPKKRVLMESFMHSCKLLSDQADVFVTDYQKKIFACKDLTILDQATYGQGREGDEIARVDVESRDHNGKGSPLSLTLNYVKAFQYSDLNDFCRTENAAWTDDGIKDALAVVLTKALQNASGNDIFHLGTNKFFEKVDHFPLPESKVGMKGFSYVVRPGTGIVLLNLDTATSTFYKPMLVSDYLKAEGLTPGTRKDLIGVRVWINFERAQHNAVALGDAGAFILDEPHRRTKTITDISMETADRQKIHGNSTVHKHMRERYHRGKPQSYCVNVGGHDATSARWYLAEDLTILPYQPYRGTLSPEMTKEMILKACRDAEGSVKAIERAGPELFKVTKGAGSESQGILDSFGIILNPRVLAVPARIVRSPGVRFADGETARVQQGKWTLNQQRFLTNDKKFNKGPCFFVSEDAKRTMDRNMAAYLKTFFDIVGVNGTLGLTGKFTGFSDENLISYKGTGVNDFMELMSEAARKGDLAVLVLPKKSREHQATYAHFKSAAEQSLGLKTLCLDGSKRRQYMNGNQPQEKLGGYAKNIGMKLNLRLGNKNHTFFNTSGPYSELFPNSLKPSDVMILGADVVHPSKGALKGTPSIAAVVGTVDSQLCQYFGSARRQPGQTEIIPRTNMRAMVEERLRAYHKSNLSLPEAIIYYRDGVGDSQYSSVRDLETEAIRDAHETVAQEKGLEVKVSITTIVVTKRHKVRFYPKPIAPEVVPPEKWIATNNGNCMPGTVVDHTLTSPYFYDFYLLSHQGLNGTARPAHYFVVVDENGFEMRQLQKLSNDICYSYARSTTAVSYATPAYYADHLCERVKQYLRPLFDGDESLYERNPSADNFNVVHESDRIENQVAVNMWSRGGGRADGNPWHPNLDFTTFWL